VPGDEAYDEGDHDGQSQGALAQAEVVEVLSLAERGRVDELLDARLYLVVERS
jgi:hypothetical protein